MRLKWGEEELKYFNKKIPKAERYDNAIIWFILAICSLCGIGYWVYVVLTK
mgnify:CR=1 FL=1